MPPFMRISLRNDKENLLLRLNHKMHKSCYPALKETSTKAVVGKGDFRAKIMFIGEAPGKNEDEFGEPFVGASGKILDSLLESIQMKRSEVYITNVFKYRPKGNRDPAKKEIAVCEEWLTEEIRIVDPVLIVTLGRHAMHRFAPDLKISDSHGCVFQTATSNRNRKTVLTLYHPAATLYNKKLQKVLFDDFQKIPALLER